MDELKRGDIIRIRWTDSAGGPSGWQTEEFLESWSKEDFLTDSVGIYWSSTKLALFFIETWSDHSTVYGMFSIPKGCIQNIEVVGSVIQKSPEEKNLIKKEN